MQAKEEAIRTCDWENPLELGQAPIRQKVALLDDPQRRNEDCDPDNAARVSSSERLERLFIGKRWNAGWKLLGYLLLGWEANRFPPAVP